MQLLDCFVTKTRQISNVSLSGILTNSMRTEAATLAGGCFWCTEAIFNRLKGVMSVTPGYTGGTLPNPSYEQVSTGTTGHAEAIQIEFDTAKISFDKLLDVFWVTHNPSTLNQQGADIGTQYRSIIFYHSDEQKKKAQDSKEKIEREKLYNNPIATEILPFRKFYKAENYHKDYYENNQNAPYCLLVIDPKIQKLLKEFAKDVKDKYIS